MKRMGPDEESDTWSTKLKSRTLVATAYSRVGLLGNPSDGYGGKAIAVSIRDWSAQVTLESSDVFEIVPGASDHLRFDSVLEAGHRFADVGSEDGLRLVRKGVAAATGLAVPLFLPPTDMCWPLMSSVAVPLWPLTGSPSQSAAQAMASEVSSRFTAFTRSSASPLSADSKSCQTPRFSPDRQIPRLWPLSPLTPPTRYSP